MITPFNAGEFRANIGRPAPSSKYLIEFSGPPDILSKAGIHGAGSVGPLPRSAERAEFVSFAAVQAELPMRQIDTLERRYNGPIRNVPVGHTYSTMNIEFIEDENRLVREFFTQWQENIFAALNRHSVPYYSNIVVPKLRIRLFGQNGKEQDNYFIYEVYPINIGSTQLGWANKDQVMTTNIEFAFHRWEHVAVDFTPTELPAKYNRTIPTKPDPAQQKVSKPKRLKANFQSIVDTIRDVNNAIKFAKGSFKTAKDLGQSIRNLKNLRANNFDDFTKAAGVVGETVRRTTDSVNDFGSGVQKIGKKFTTEQVNRFFTE